MAGSPFSPYGNEVRSDRKKLFIRNSTDPLQASPLYFQTETASNTLPRQTPAGHHLSQHVTGDFHHYRNSSRRSLPPSEPAFDRFSDTASVSSRSTDSHLDDGGVRRRSLPPNLGSPARGSRRSDRSDSVPLWSLNEESLHEPMDISPEKSVSKPMDVSPNQSLSESVYFESRSQHSPTRVTKAPLPPLQGIRPLRQEDREKAEKERRLREDALKRNGDRTKKNRSFESNNNEASEKAEEVDGKAKPKKTGRGWIRWCFIMLAELAIGAGVLVASMMGVDIVGYWCVHYKGLNTTQLSHTLQERVYGQHIAVETIPTVLNDYLHHSSMSSQPPLVLSFHGWTGIGKNHVSFLISEHLRRGTAVKIISTLHFPHENENYTQALEDRIYPNLASCKLNLFIVDEIDKAPESVIAALQKVLRKLRAKEFVQENKRVVFILLSNTGASEINRHVLEVLTDHKQRRESIQLSGLVKVLNIAQNLQPEDFDWFTRLHKNGLIDYVIPFLPLERKHVEKCAAADMRSKGIYVTDTTIRKVVSEMSFIPAEQPIFSASGCRKVPTKVDVTGN